MSIYICDNDENTNPAEVELETVVDSSSWPEEGLADDQHTSLFFEKPFLVDPVDHITNNQYSTATGNILTVTTRLT